MRVLVR